ncbi:TDP-N-acetylfucosamine:lipid II N-acetylfucosaminyltransferase [Pseudoalteromonas sp. HL-AS2]|uniref:TDP-N-acetylfucosamine:lipid II N-acetylfucosaminyltransferase n=1 Tax=Pseudoalteromonas sp. HL-AS2 TaxID=3071082 RepID=UPI0028162DBD|nr:TDP-N-acetylfucosamine:lipid II N-acetylfucosaminyltransferase [Pseudoalteromonas sp. HL-AS2]WMS94882.1 TDP-N-acetylfucosamine:lipid II N-acetylfucosaminyltransferase [Pseudoalteromonas sp. HL-AS2]
MQELLASSENGKRILHIGNCDKFIPPFIEFVSSHFNFEEHDFFLTSGMADSKIKKSEKVTLLKQRTLKGVRNVLSVLFKIHKADKVILHGLFDINLVILLCCIPWQFKKCYWVIWGGDLYSHSYDKRTIKWRLKEFFRKIAIRNFGHLVTYIHGDLELARSWYNAKGQQHECLMYSSNLYKEYAVPKSDNSFINIQIGNSADPSNNHIEVLERLLPFKDENINIYLPLSYGSTEYAQRVITKGKLMFGEKFKPITDFMEFNEYLSFLGTIDVAIFNHKRQQAMGNTITLLGLGKTVYLRDSTAQWQFFKEKGIKVKNINELNALDKYISTENIKVIKDYFSEKNYLMQLRNLFS